MKKPIVYTCLFLLAACGEPTRQIDKTDLQQPVPTPRAMAKASIPKALLPAVQTFAVDPKRTSTIKIGNKGTQLHIPKNAFVDASGKTITAEVKIKYQEFQNSAEMAFSEIPMDLRLNGKDYNFNSSGMFSIQGESEGKSIRIADGKALKIDYELARKNPDTDFYRLKADSSNWELVQEIPEIAKPVAADSTASANPVMLEVNGVAAKEGVKSLPVFNKKEMQAWGDKTFAVKGSAVPAVFPDKNDRTSATLLGDGFLKDAGHTYPDVVKGLNISTFGVYNCDQIYRVGNLTQIRASYTDEKGNKITDGQILSLIDLNYNGAFSFSPASFFCNAKANNVLLLFTRSKKMYMLEKGLFAKANIANGMCTFKMTDVTARFQTSKQLWNYLK